jgi:hypothetical protein
MPTTVVNLTAEADIEKMKPSITIASRRRGTEISVQPRYNGEPTAYQMRQALREQFEPLLE